MTLVLNNIDLIICTQGYFFNVSTFAVNNVHVVIFFLKKLTALSHHPLLRRGLEVQPEFSSSESTLSHANLALR